MNELMIGLIVGILFGGTVGFGYHWIQDRLDREIKVPTARGERRGHGDSLCNPNRKFK